MVATITPIETNGAPLPMAPNPTRPPTTREAPFVFAHARIPVPRGLSKLVEAVETDYQFRLGLLVICSLAESIRVTVTVNGPDPDGRAARLAANLEEKWYAVLPDALRAFAFGRAAFERTYRIEKGLALVDELAYLPFDDTTLRIGEDGGFEGVVVHPTGADEPLALSPAESWWCAIDPTVKEPHGKSRYLGAVTEVWKSRRELDRNEEIWYRKFALGHGVGKAPSEYPPTQNAKGSRGELGNDGQPRDPMQDLADGIAGMDSGSTLVIDSGLSATGSPLFAYEPPSTRQDASALEGRRQRLDDAALRAMGVTERSATQNSDVGTNAMAATHLDVTFATVEGVVAQIANAYQAVIDDAVGWNWLCGCGPTMTLDWQSLSGSSRVEQIKDIVRQMLSAPTVSPLLIHGAVDFAALLEMAELPLGPDVPGALEAIKESMVVAPAIGGFGGPAQMRLATAPPAVPTEDAVAAQSIADDEPLLAELKAALGASADDIDRRRL